MNRLLAALILALPAAALAQPVASPPSAPASTPDPVRLEAANRLLAVMMPPARRQTLVNTLLAVSNANIAKGMNANPAFARAMSDDPRVKPIFLRFIRNQEAALREQLSANMPDMMTAMQRAYARRFSVAQMDEIRTFFASPTGQIYMDQGANIMADPDVAGWQQKMIAQQMAKMPEATRALAAEIMALPLKEKAK